jgi:hypothetical protein
MIMKVHSELNALQASLKEAKRYPESPNSILTSLI